MKKNTCELSANAGKNTDEWRRHASVCPECSDVLLVADWMTALAEKTSPPSTLPRPGYLLAKASIQRRQAAAERTTWPIQIVMGFAVLLFASLLAGLTTSDTRLGSIMSDALGLVAGFVGLILALAVIGVIAYALSFYLLRDSKE